MCEKCQELDEKIARYRRMSDDVDDKNVVALLSGFIADLESEKVGLHPVPDK
jgi:hypothetical protein